VFTVSFSIFLIFSHFFHTGFIDLENKFFSQDFDEDKKIIILLGSSHVGQLNTTHIEEYITKKNPEYKIYNLAYGADTPERRLESLDKLISLKPTLVLYGISYRDLSIPIMNNNLFPDPKLYFHDFASSFGTNLEINNPKLITLEYIRNAQNNSILFVPTERITFPNTPFFVYYAPSQMSIVNETELGKRAFTSEAASINIVEPSINRQTISLIKLVNGLERNGAKVVLFTAPLHKFYLEELTNSQNETFNKTLEKISNESQVKIYNLTEKYSDLPIWINVGHIAFNKNSLIYSDDISKIIEEEIER